MSIEKFLNAFEKIDRFMNKEPAPARVSEFPPIRIMQITMTPIDVFLKHLKQLVVLGALFAVFISILSFSTGNSIGCSFNSPEGAYPYACTAEESAARIVFLLLRLLIIVVFARTWYRAAFTEEKTFTNDTLVISVRDWKLYAATLFFLLLNLLPVISMILLVQRVPNPDWKIESLYFAVVSCGFWLPIIAVRFYGVLAFIIKGQKIPSPLMFLRRTKDNVLKILLSLFFIVLCCSIMAIVSTNGLKTIFSYNYLLMGIICEFLYNIVFLAVVALISCYIVCMQQEVFANEEKH